MAGSWGSKHNGVRIGFFYDSIEMNAAGTQARIKGGKIRIDRDVNISDSTNSLSWEGGAVTDGSSSNLNLSGSGAKTIKSVTGQWQTLNTATAVKATASAKLSGVNYAGSTLYVSVTVTYPLAGDGGTVSPVPSTGGEVYTNPWEDENAPDFATEPYVEHAYTVRIAGIEVPAWDIQVVLNGGSMPWATATLKAPLSTLTEGSYNQTNPRLNPIIQIDAGWKYPGAVNVHTLFSGVITSRSLIADSSGTYVVYGAESYESILEYPSNVTSAVPDTNNSVKQFYDASAFYRKPTWIEPTTNVAPDSAALSEYVAMEISAGDDVGDTMRSMASAMGQWMRGSLSSAVPAIECISDPYPYQRLIELDVAAFDKLERTENLDDWANILRLTATWISGGSTTSKRQTYYASSVTSGTGAVRSKDVTLNMKPPGGNTPSTTWSPGLKWLRRVNEASRGSWTGTSRAIWWLQPRVDGVLLKGNPLNDTGGQVQRVTFMVDQGLMAITWNVVHA